MDLDETLFFPVAGGAWAGDSVWSKGWFTPLNKDAENFTDFGASHANG